VRLATSEGERPLWSGQMSMPLAKLDCNPLQVGAYEHKRVAPGMDENSEMHRESNEHATKWQEECAKCSLLIAAALIGFSTPASANWWIVRSSDETCLVVDIEPKGEERGITKIGKDAYPTAEQAEADVKRLCKGSKADSKHDNKDIQ
jgi:hypothetical protein